MKYKASVFITIILVFLIQAKAQAQSAGSPDDRIRQLESQIDSYNQEIQKKENEAQSLAGQIAIFDFQIKQAQLEIDATNLAIRQLVSSIGQKEKDIAKKQADIETQNNLLSKYLREAANADTNSLFELILKNRRFSDFFNDLNYNSNIQSKIQDTLAIIKNLKLKLQSEKNDLEESKTEQEQLRQIQKKQKASLEASKKDKQKLLTQTKGQESIYQQLVKKAQADITAIKNQAYNLALGFKMTFEKALSYALPASQRTGIRAAFLLAIVKIESDWGGNVGKGNWQADMHPRDRQAFQQITSTLGLNPDTTPVSARPSYGWGGAMGPAQFLPTTWLLYVDAVASLTGNRPPSPWNVDDAFTAAGLKLAEAGAKNQAYDYDAENKAARIYIAGNRWRTSLTARLYANAVLNEATKIQRDINLINQSN